MDGERHEEHHATETHRVEHSESAEREDLAAEVVAPAAAAVALAETAAAAAQIDAAERVREIEEGADEWRTTTETQLAATVAAVSDLSAKLNALTSLEEERHSRRTALDARLNEIEARLPQPSIPSPSNEAEVTDNPGNPNLAGAGAEVSLGPIAAEASGGLSSEAESSPSPSEAAPPTRRRHRWI